jgi:HPt (histidine-containing phosphotransfer) domain-containing protein
MLIYNHKKEFIGIDKRDLEALGFSDLTKLLAECNDLAELFVKTPGYIHDFKHVHWIDFITCAQSNEDTKVIIHTSGKSYKATLHIDTIYLLAAPTQKSYSVTLANLRELSKEESQHISDDILDRPIPKASIGMAQPVHEEEYQEPEATPTPAQTFKEEPLEEEFTPIEDVYEESADIIVDDFDQVQSDAKLDLELEEEIPQEEVLEIEDAYTKEDEDDFKLDLDDIHADATEELTEELTIEEPLVAEEKPAPTKAATSQAVAEDDDFDYDYIYDPNVASEELGLPLDLIEEFIQDFINQAYEFKDELYQSLDEGRLDNVRILSHKLKGVAANLRIEDAFDVLVTVNTSDDVNKILLNLNRFYKIIAKLAGEEIPQEQSLASTAPSSNEEDFAQEDFALDIEEEGFALDLKEEETKPKETAELPEDDFALDFKEEETKQEEEEEDLYLDYNTEALENESFAVNDSEVPEKIEIAELADDDFVHTLDEEETSQTLEDPKLDLDLEDEIFAEDVEPLEIQEEEALKELQSEPPYHSSYDKSVVASEIGLTKESFNELFNDYIEDSRELLGDLQSALENDDATQYKKAALKFKGMSDNMRIHDFTKELESLITTDDAQSAKETIKTIESKLNSLTKIED